ncbi:hypothetical protein MF672_015915 [Actinomadura sp. ATCC 31491]|uniref:Uncharacterized protein n=1 Tax=Actinomadura luzonensis TaxID=2805427 RepID=A0ABT0FTN6_9ACTN|nr:hypothetical protein [Actinomadura luzonensis]MCK2215263.1 hypothetical protein [Actinomadura luzonensis]
MPGYRIRYVDHVFAPGGEVAPCRWGRLPHVRETVLAGDFEDHVVIGVGAARRLGFRAQELAGPTVW